LTRRRRPEHAIRTRVRVNLHHCDLLGVAWHGRYYEWLEVARTELFISRELDIPAIRDLGFKMFITESRCRNMAPLAYGDEVEITAWFSQVTPLIRVAYDLHNVATERWSARAATILATTDFEGRLCMQTPAELLRRLPALPSAP